MSYVEEKQSAQGDEGVSTWRSASSIVMTAIGLGILAMPRAVAEAGWITGALSLILSSLVAGTGGILLWRACFLNPKSRDTPMRTFEEIGEASFGRAGAIVSSMTLHSLLIFVCAVLLLVLANSLFSLTRVLSHKIWLLISGALCLPLAWIKNMKEVGLVAAFGVVSVGGAVIAIITASIAEFVQSEASPEYRLSSSSPLALVSTFNTFLLSFTVSVTEPTVIASMEKPKEFPKALIMAFGFILIVYAGVSFIGYLAFGSDLLVRDTIVEAIAPPGRPLTASAWIINIIMVLLVVVHFLVLFMPTAHLIDSLLCVGDLKRWRNRTVAEVVRILSRSIQLFICVGLGLAIPSVDRLVSILAAFCCIVLSVTLPIAFYVRLKYINEERCNRLALGGLITLFLLSFGAIGAGLYSAITS